LALLLISGFLGVVLFFSLYDVVDSYSMSLLPAMVALMPFVAIGAKVFCQALRDLGWVEPALLVLAGALVIALMACANWDYADRSSDLMAYRFAEAVMTHVEPNAFVVTQWTSGTPLWYMQIVEGRRPDVEIFDRGGFSLGVRDRLLRSGETDAASISETTFNELVARIEQELASGRPVYITENDPLIRRAFCSVPLTDDVYQLRSCTADIDSDTPADGQ
jgi:hypothetical protein